jgi:predicted GIY-YIG superfamily endonuclease
MNIEDQLFGEGFENGKWLLASVIYVLLLNDACVYVGRSENMLARLLKHRSAGKISFNRVLIKTVPRDLAFAEEARLIRALKPTLNVASTPKIKRMTKAEIAEQARLLRRSLRKDGNGKLKLGFERRI